MAISTIFVDKQTPINEALFRLGYRIKQTDDPAQRQILRGEMPLFTGTDPMFWRWLIQTNQVEFRGEN